MTGHDAPELEPESTVEFTVTARHYESLFDNAHDIVTTLVRARRYRLDLHVTPAASTADSRIVQWRATVTATIYPEETTR